MIRALTAAVLFPGLTFAASGQICPYLNDATVSGILRAPVVTHVKNEDRNAFCRFTSQRPPKQALDIRVRSLPQGGTAPLCRPAPAKPMRAIGNEANFCTTDHHGKTEVEVVGRVRDRVFVIDLATSSDRKAALEQARTAAEQVSGILF